MKLKKKEILASDYCMCNLHARNSVSLSSLSSLNLSTPSGSPSPPGGGLANCSNNQNNMENSVAAAPLMLSMQYSNSNLSQVLCFSIQIQQSSLFYGDWHSFSRDCGYGIFETHSALKLFKKKLQTISTRHAMGERLGDSEYIFHEIVN